MRQCTACRVEKSVVEFSFRNKSTGRLQNRCKMCQCAYGRQHYKSNKREYILRAAEARPERRAKNREWVRELKEFSGCVDCKEFLDHWKLQFDHISGDKIANVSRMVQSGTGISTIQKEINKCEIVCANCHADRTWRRHQVQVSQR